MKSLFKNKTILITGASSGMGKEIARNVAAEAKEVILIARRGHELDILLDEFKFNYPKLLVHIMKCDLAELDEVEVLTKKIKNDIFQVDIIINAAGVGQTEFLENAPFDEINRLVQVNIIALSYLCHAFLPAMIKNGHGGILNFSSFFGLKVLPGYTAYSGTKHFVTGFTEALRAEVAHTDIIVSAVFPGPVKSTFWDTDNADLFLPPSFLFISVEQCVRETLNGFKKGRAHIVPSFRMKLFLIFLTMSPPVIERMVNASLAKMIRAKQKKLIPAYLATNSKPSIIDKNC